MSAGRSFADPLSSALTLSDYDLARGLGDLLVRRLPSFLLPQLMHELTHQWCFNSVVGRCITLLLFRAQREAALGDPERRVERDIARAEFVQQLMLPLAEGLATFAEHDLYPGPGESTARPLIACAPLVAFDSGGLVSESELFPNLAKRLYSARITPSHRDRRASLMLEPLRASDSPYGVGYLSTKALQLNCAYRDVRLLDADLFLQVVHAHFYEDWDLVSLLLDDAIDIDDFPATCAAYLRDRYIALIDLVDGAAIDAFVTRSLNVEQARHKLTRVISGFEYAFYIDWLTPASRQRDAERRFSALMDHALTCDGLTDDRLSTLVALQFTMYAAAQVVTLGGQDVRARRTATHLIVAMDKDGEIPAAALPYSGPLPAGWSGQLRAVSVFVVELSHLVVMMFDGEQLVADVGLAELKAHQGASTLTDQIASPLLDPRQRHVISQLCRQLTTETVGPDSAVYRGTSVCRALLDQMYLPIVCHAHATPDALRAAVQSLSGQSLLAMLDHDLESIERAALMSLHASSPYMAPRFDATDLAASAVDVNNRLRPLLGYAPVLLSDKGLPFFSTV